MDGVPTVWTQTPGSLHAGLILRVGSADETLTTSGVTHALEHLALFGVARPGDHANAFVDQSMTMFHVNGSVEQVVDFFDKVTRQLAAPPLDRLADELGILRTEEANQKGAVEQALLAWRYGAQGYGLPAQDALGLHRLDGPAVLAWSARFATRANAALWLSGPPPAGLRLSLPDGRFQPPPDPRAGILPNHPCWFTGPRDGAALHTVVTRDSSASALAHILSGRLVDELRVKRAAAYSPCADYKPLTGTIARLLAVTDLVEGRESEAVRPFLRSLERLADPGGEGAVTPDDVAEWQARAAQHDDEPRVAAGLAYDSAFQLAFGEPARDVGQMLAERAAITAEDVTNRAREAFANVLACVPPGMGTVLPPWSEAPVTQLGPLTGAEHRSLDYPEVTDRLIVASTGITRRGSGTTQVTVPVAATAAVLRWDDGRRVLVGTDANRIDIEPTLWYDGRKVVEHIDQTWPADLTVDLGSREESSIPTPRTTGTIRPDRVRRWLKPELIIPIPLLILVVVLAITHPHLSGAAGRSLVIFGLSTCVASYWNARHGRHE